MDDSKVAKIKSELPQLIRDEAFHTIAGYCGDLIRICERPRSPANSESGELQRLIGHACERFPAGPYAIRISAEALKHLGVRLAERPSSRSPAPDDLQNYVFRHCALPGEVLLVKRETQCEVCDCDAENVTVESIQKVLEYYINRPAPPAEGTEAIKKLMFEAEQMLDWADEYMRHGKAPTYDQPYALRAALQAAQATGTDGGGK